MNQAESFLNFMVMHIRKPANEGISLGSNEKKNAEKHMNKIEATFAEGK